MTYATHGFKPKDKLYASQLNEMDAQIAENDACIRKINDDGVDFGLAYIWETDALVDSSDAETVNLLSNHDLIVSGKMYSAVPTADFDPLLTTVAREAVTKAKAQNPKLRHFHYVQCESGRTDYQYNGEHVRLNEDGSWEGSPAALAGCTRIYNFDELKEWFAFIKSSGSDGVFLDDWGYDFAIEDICYQMGYTVSDYSSINDALNKKWCDIIDACHAADLSLITNGGFPADVGDWYTHLDENDIICFESCLVSSAGNVHQSGQAKLFNYYTNYRKTGLCKAKSWSLDYMPGLEGITYNASIYQQEQDTFEIVTALGCGADYVSSSTHHYMVRPVCFFQKLPSEDEKAIIQESAYVYQAKFGNVILRSRLNNTIAGLVSSQDTLDLCSFQLNNIYFNNLYITPGEADYKLNSKIESVETTVSNMSKDSKSNANSYWRLFIDDWHFKNVLASYTNLIDDIGVWNGYYSKDASQVTEGDPSSFKVTFGTAGWHAITLAEMYISDAYNAEYRGKTLEIGAKGISVDMSPGTNFKFTLLYKTSESDTYQYAYNIQKSASCLDDNSDGFSWQITIDNTLTYFALFLCPYDDDSINSSGSISLTNAYMIDVDEYADEVTKTWYTNMYNDAGVTNGITVSASTETVKGHSLLDLEYAVSNVWGYTSLEITGDALDALRGHTIEIGVSSIDLGSDTEIGHPDSDGHYVDFGIATQKNDIFPEYASCTHFYGGEDMETSSAFGDSRWCHKLTVPESITILCIGIRIRGYSASSTIKVNGLYVYDIDEEDVAVRGKESANSTLRICRVTSTEETEDPSDATNSLYFDEKGNVWCVGIDKEAVVIAGGIYAGAKDAGYTGTPQEFGAALYALLSKS